jgi:outer membrane protein assembly factor BamA
VDEDSLGPSDVFARAAGGQASVVLNQEIRMPIYRWLRGVGFVDAGNVFATPSSIDLRQLTGAVGGGLRIATPFALLRVDYGRVVFGTPAGSARWTFGIGQTF